MFTPEELYRYARHFILPNVGTAGQAKLKSSRVLIIGAGGLGSPLALYLAAAGIGTLGILDFDVVDASNLQRQILYAANDVGTQKVIAAKEKILSLNPNVHVEIFSTRLTSENAIDILKTFDVIADGTDNFPTRYLVNDACVILKKPMVYGSIFQFEGQVTVFNATHGPCYRCLFPQPPDVSLVQNCAEAGVFGVLPGIIGTLQATEVIKMLLQIGTTLAGRMILIDTLQMHFQEITLRKNNHCPMCGDHPSIHT